MFGHTSGRALKGLCKGSGCSSGNAPGGGDGGTGTTVGGGGEGVTVGGTGTAKTEMGKSGRDDGDTGTGFGEARGGNAEDNFTQTQDQPFSRFLRSTSQACSREVLP